MDELKNKNILVYGTGLSGESAVSFLLKNQANVFVYDDKVPKKTFDRVTYIYNFDDVQKYNITMCILSPGVQILGNKNIDALKTQNIPYMSEFELGFKFSKGTKICVTGTNGKTTTVTLLYKIFSSFRKNVFLCGNTEIPITSICEQTNNKSILICEVSSFALESAIDIKPDCSAILNITTDHISRHINFENYKNAKLNLIKNQNKNQFFVCQNDFIYKKTNAKIIDYSLFNNGVNGCYIKNNIIFNKNKKIMKVDKIKLKGTKNLQNILCAITIAKLYKVKNRYVSKAINNFKPLKHRMEYIAEIDGVEYINDSKATNPDSTLCAINSFSKPIILLLGGSDKGYSYDEIFKNLETTRAIIAFGAVRKKIVECAQKHRYENIMQATNLNVAINLAYSIAISGDVVLLSPANASFDEFENYEKRGESFCEIVGKIDEREKQNNK